MLGSIGAGVGAIINRPRNLVELSEYGRIVQSAIREIPVHYSGVTIENSVVMPNHLHMILAIDCGRLIIAPTVSTIVQQFKRHVSKQIGFSLWQKSFHDHIIRNDRDYSNISEYIDNNPFRWQDDCFYPK